VFGKMFINPPTFSTLGFQVHVHMSVPKEVESAKNIVPMTFMPVSLETGAFQFQSVHGKMDCDFAV